MKALVLLLCLATFNLGAQENEFNQILSVKNIQITEPIDFTSGNPVIKSTPLLEDDALAIKLDESSVVKKSVFYEAYAVWIQNLNGYNFHIADYWDGTRVVTCLDGGMVGLQAISVNGIKMVESTNVKWYNNRFVHRYPAGKVTSYSYKQTSEVY